MGGAGGGIGVAGCVVVVVLVLVLGGCAAVVAGVVELGGDDVVVVAGVGGGRLSKDSRVEAGDAFGWACGEIATGGFVIWASAIAAAATRTYGTSAAKPRRHWDGGRAEAPLTGGGRALARVGASDTPATGAAETQGDEVATDPPALHPFRHKRAGKPRVQVPEIAAIPPAHCRTTAEKGEGARPGPFSSYLFW
jgi:hypothetical protein